MAVHDVLEPFCRDTRDRAERDGCTDHLIRRTLAGVSRKDLHGSDRSDVLTMVEGANVAIVFVDAGARSLLGLHECGGRGAVLGGELAVLRGFSRVLLRGIGA
jgi:hypothetical protein